ncbi:hypothetical protein [Nocardia camponoti]|uniref:Uncharacterized protein n=1 Tax=Nocardia camponoti TaxID=1616106 RepID=A0A917QBB1_9NOCA|nr:hypothetical protein [Nocardia camponoti]GGK41547.1 hypothetical protein GCM10011591_11260 [Nocardia camponoti]
MPTMSLAQQLSLPLLFDRGLALARAREVDEELDRAFESIPRDHSICPGFGPRWAVSATHLARATVVAAPVLSSSAGSHALGRRSMSVDSEASARKAAGIPVREGRQTRALRTDQLARTPYSVRSTLSTPVPNYRVDQARVGLATLAICSLTSALIVVAFLALAHLRAGDFAGQAEFGTQKLERVATVDAPRFAEGVAYR